MTWQDKYVSLGAINLPGVSSRGRRQPVSGRTHAAVPRNIYKSVQPLEVNSAGDTLRAQRTASIRPQKLI